jgi:hypothetical protein
MATPVRDGAAILRGLLIVAGIAGVGSVACSEEPGGRSDASGPDGGGGSAARGGAGTAASAGTAGGAGRAGNASAGRDGGGRDASAVDAAPAGGSGGRDAAVADSGAPRPPGMANQSCVSPSPPFTAQEQMLVDLPADSWFAIPDSELGPHCPEPGACGNVIEAWSGGTFDPVHRQMLIFGGGHGDYFGNEVYAFRLANLSWQRLTEPSPEALKNADPLPDGKPASRHTYDGISYVAHADRMFVHGGSRWQDGSGTNVSWSFDPVARAWENRLPAEDPPFTNCCDEASAYDPVTKRVYFHLTKLLAAYDWEQNTWVKLQDYGEPPYWPRYEVWGDKRAALDSKRSLLWVLGAKLVMVYDIASGSHVTDEWITTGGASFSNADDVGSHNEQIITTGGGEVIRDNAPGVDYDVAADALVAWVGGAPWILDLSTKVWSRSSAAGGPAQPSDRGTYGRFRYVERLNVFLLVNAIDQNVYVYKHRAGCGE